MTKILVSILSANFARLSDDIIKLQSQGFDGLHYDVMDGDFVPNISIGACVLQSIKQYINQPEQPIDVHLMVSNIDDKKYLIDQYSDIGVEFIYFHYEACKNFPDMISYIKSKKIAVGIAVNPYTDIADVVNNVDLSCLDRILLMSVQPGFGGQKFLDIVLNKIQYVRQRYHKLSICVDGGVNAKNIATCSSHGADCCVVGSAAFKPQGLDVVRNGLHI